MAKINSADTQTPLLWGKKILDAKKLATITRNIPQFFTYHKPAILIYKFSCTALANAYSMREKMDTIIKEKKIHKAHDKIFKIAMSDLRIARDFLSHYLSTEEKEEIDLNTLQLCKESSVDPELNELVADLGS